MRTPQSYDYSAHQALSKIIRGSFSQYYVSFRNTYDVEEWYPLFRSDAYQKAQDFGLDDELTDYHHLRDYEFISFAQCLLTGTKPAIPEIVLVDTATMALLIEITRSADGQAPSQVQIESLVNLLRKQEPSEPDEQC